MTEYIEMIKALRETDFSDGCHCESEPMCKDKDCIIVQAADAIEELLPRWIPVTERLPEPGSVVLAYSSELFTVIAYYNDDEEWDIPDPEITHWMPLPAPPKEETE